jgi:hypothetical protein
MAKGFKTGGRQAGTPNKATAAVQDRLAELGFDPLAAMVALANDPLNSPELRGRMAAELAGYLYPKRKAVELTAEVTTNDLKGPCAADLHARLEKALQGRQSHTN